MVLPKCNEFFSPLLLCLSDGEIHTIQEIREYCIKTFSLSEDDTSSRLPSGPNVLSTRVAWAQTILKNAGFIESPRWASLILTEKGKEVVKNSSGDISLSYLSTIPEFDKVCSKKYSHDSKKSSCDITDEKSQSPHEIIEDALDELKSSLADDLMDEVMKLEPYQFEQLINNLLSKIGYGTSTTTKKSRDGGIDGVLTADKLGFGRIYTQAKHWKKESVVGVKEIKEFVGTIYGEGGDRGVFITTSRFSKDAWTYAGKQLNCKIVLIDGEQLADLMIEYNFGVSTVATYEVKRVDSDYFNDL